MIYFEHFSLIAKFDWTTSKSQYNPILNTKLSSKKNIVNDISIHRTSFYDSAIISSHPLIGFIYIKK